MKYWSIPHPWIVPRKNDGSGRTSWFFLSRTFPLWFLYVTFTSSQITEWILFCFYLIFWCCTKAQSFEKDMSELMRWRSIWCCYIDINIENVLKTKPNIVTPLISNSSERSFYYQGDNATRMKCKEYICFIEHYIEKLLPKMIFWYKLEL